MDGAPAPGAADSVAHFSPAIQADLLLSTQLLTTTRVLNHVLGYNTLEVEYLAGGSLRVRRTGVEEGSVLAERRLADVTLPRDSLVLVMPSSRSREWRDPGRREHVRLGRPGNSVPQRVLAA